MGRLAWRAATFSLSRVAWPWLKRRGESTNWRDRWFARAPREGVDVWIHTPSLGEAAPLAPLIADLKSDLRFGITATSGRSLRGLVDLFGAHADVRPLPLPGSPALAKLILAWRPRRLVLLEAEAWPELLWDVPANGATVAVLGGRVGRAAAVVWRSALRSGYEWLRGVWVGDESQAKPYRRLGIAADRIHTDFFAKLLTLRPTIPPPEFARWRTGHGPFVVAGSMHPDEIPPVAAAWSRLIATHPTARLLVVPRHPDRTAALAGALRATGLAPSIWPEVSAVTLIPRFGVLAGLYGLSDVALVGGSWNRLGGHNPVEALAHGVPVVMGPSVEHQRDLLRALPPQAVVVGPHDLAAALAAAITRGRHAIGATLGPRLAACEAAARMAIRP